MIEYEKKIPISYAEYSDILNLNRGSSKTVVQTNYYYDTDDYMMNNQGVTCRIREINGRFVAAIKDHICKDSEFSVENTRPVSSADDDSFFENLGIKLQGHLVTERTKICSNMGITAVIDKNTYLDTTDYELEVEYYTNREELADEMIRKLATSCASNNEEFLSRTKLSKSKSERFFERKKMLADKQKG